MLEISGPAFRHCDGIRRRRFLSVGAAGIAGITLAEMLRAEDAAGVRNSNRAIINVHLDGGPPQLDTIDPKPDAPAEIRGEFGSIATSLPGVRICELMPRLAQMADRLTLVRSLVGSDGKHHAFQCQSGFEENNLASLGGRPAIGCVVSKLLGSPDDMTPAFVDLMQGRPLVRNSARPGFLGPAHQPFRPDLSAMFQRELEPGMQNELRRLGGHHATSLTLNPTLSGNRLENRQQLRTALDRIHRDLDASGMMDAMDQFQRQAVGVLTSGRLADALDLTEEDPRVLRKYTADSPRSGTKSTTSEGPESTRKFLLARRLIEAGVRCVSVSISDFDTHSSNFPRLRHLLPIVDHGLSALIDDLDERGMLDDVIIVAWGEFGRTPRINDKNGGRDHWPRVGPAILAGGGIRSGRVIGETDRTASAVISEPVTYKDIAATLYRSLGIDPHRVTIPDTQGRPQYLLDDGAPIV